MTIAEAVLLGFVQGLTEFLPISSKTHLVVVPALLGRPPPDLAFIVLLHLGTFAALVAYFARELFAIVVEAVRGGPGRRTAVLLAVATVPASVIGLLFEKTFERLLSRPTQAAFALATTAVLLVGAEWLAGTFGGRIARPVRREARILDAIGMGIAQAFALLPGVSRSGSTMATGLGLGLHRAEAARFSFLMAIPVIAGANVLELPEVASGGFGAPEVAGFLAAAVSGYVAVFWLLRYLRTRSFLPFAAYCVVFAVGAGLTLVLR
jgi:undecaprenyl-diphosphatase